MRVRIIRETTLVSTQEWDVDVPDEVIASDKERRETGGGRPVKEYVGEKFKHGELTIGELAPDVVGTDWSARELVETEHGPDVRSSDAPLDEWDD